MILPAMHTPVEQLLAVTLACYLLGSISFGIIVSRTMGLGNLRNFGSGNIGATNVLRTGNKIAAFLTLALDLGKGGAAVLVTKYAVGAPDAVMLAGLGVFAGHLFPVWHSFKGGKGVATFFGILLALDFYSGAVACMTWLIVALLFRISSLSALVSALFAPALIWLLGSADFVLGVSAISLGVWIRHHQNIRRLFNGTESKISFRSNSGNE